MELIYKSQVKEYTLKIAERDSESISRPETVFNIIKDDFNPVQEEMYLLILNTKNNVIDKHLVSKGSISSTVITPAEIFRPIFLTNGNNFILAHNHPSGDSYPSEEDIIFTKRIKKASEVCGLHLLDHVIYSSNNFQSLKQLGLL
jgi:DNA repair protein RadC